MAYTLTGFTTVEECTEAIRRAKVLKSTSEYKRNLLESRVLGNSGETVEKTLADTIVEITRLETLLLGFTEGEVRRKYEEALRDAQNRKNDLEDKLKNFGLYGKWTSEISMNFYALQIAECDLAIAAAEAHAATL